jgi:hypothetical protein
MGREISNAECAEAKASGLVVMFGYSDDNVELRGAIYDELWAFGGAKIYVTRAGLLANKCSDDGCPHFLALRKSATVIVAEWNDSGFCWTFKVPFPHATFEIYEGNDPFCRGVVFALADVPENRQVTP